MHKYRIEIKWALIFVAMTLVWVGLERAVGLHGPHIDRHVVFTNFIALPAVAIYVLALIDKRRHYYSGRMTYRQGFLTGAVITGIIVFLSPLTQWLVQRVISPDYFPNMIAYAVEAGHASRVDAEANFQLGSYILQAAVGSLVLGLMTTAVVAWFTRRP
ncbi:hypothetical protein LEM8419_00125 [Neolewinella maritima]|uniref:DUF4199 domain-containing protein n=2 Tax=Neolewinella maritima TaxID=1383882 RepID=A0ABM9AW08_9BACT|nr:hypothetical protein LEM8419_00125 [Neolewinella maritima]